MFILCFSSTSNHFMQIITDVKCCVIKVHQYIDGLLFMLVTGHHATHVLIMSS